MGWRERGQIRLWKGRKWKERKEQLQRNAIAKEGQGDCAYAAAFRTHTMRDLAAQVLSDIKMLSHKLLICIWSFEDAIKAGEKMK